MRAYTVATAAVTLNVPSKWLDNVLSQNDIPGVVRVRQGVARRLTPKAILMLDLAIHLTRGLDASVPSAIELATTLSSEGRIRLSSGLTITADLALLEAELSERLAHAVEIAPSPRRGRPPRER